jgi:hypothetical protein
MRTGGDVLKRAFLVLFIMTYIGLSAIATVGGVRIIYDFVRLQVDRDLSITYYRP